MKKRNILFVSIIASSFLLISLVYSTIESDKELISWNKNIDLYMSRISTNPVFVASIIDSFTVYQANVTGKDYFDIIQGLKEHPLQYSPYLSYDIPLMPMKISQKIVLCQAHCIKIYTEKEVYEYKTEGAIVSITYPVEIDSSVIINIIESDYSNKYVLKRIVFSKEQFHEQLLRNINISPVYRINKIGAEVSFFSFDNETIEIVLIDTSGNANIYSISEDMVTKIYDGQIIIPNKFNEKDLWYIKYERDNDKFSIMKNDDKIYETNDRIVQGYFIENNLLELFFYDTENTDKLDFANGPWWPKISSVFFDLENRKITPMHFKHYWKDGNIFSRSKIIKDNLLIIF